MMSISPSILDSVCDGIYIVWWAEYVFPHLTPNFTGWSPQLLTLRVWNTFTLSKYNVHIHETILVFRWPPVAGRAASMQVCVAFIFVPRELLVAWPRCSRQLSTEAVREYPFLEMMFIAVPVSL